MSGIKLKDILRNKRPGDEWYTLEAPEQVRFWQYHSPWPTNLLEACGVQPSALRVKGNQTTESNTSRFTKKAPMMLPSGVKIDEGQSSTLQTRSAGFLVRVDSTREFNSIMKELSLEFDIQVWEITQTFMWSNAALLEHKVFNPDGNGAGLYFYRVTQEKKTKLYPDVLYSEQERLVNKYKSKIAHCAAAKEEHMVHSCAIRKNIKSEQVRKRNHPLPK